MDEHVKQYGITWVGIIVILILLIVLGAMFLPLFIKYSTRETFRPASCISNQRQIAMFVQLYAQDHNNNLPGALTWTAGQISGSHTTWVSDCGISGPVLHCIDSHSAMSYGMAVELAGGNVDSVAAANAADVLLTADAITKPGSVPPMVDGLLCSLDDIDAKRHIYRHRHARFIASFLDGHVMMIYPNSSKPANVEDLSYIERYATMNDALDATFLPASPVAGDILYQGADHLFVIDGVKGAVSGKSFISADYGRTHYFAFYYATVPKKGLGITIIAPGGPVTLSLPTLGKYYTIFVRPSDVKHTITATLKGTTLTITNNT